MTNTEIIQAIKAEIERLKKDNEISEDENYAQYELDVACGYDGALDDVLGILSTLESEKPMNQELEMEIDKYREEHLFDMPAFQQVARHFAEWGAEHLKK